MPDGSVTVPGAGFGTQTLTFNSDTALGLAQQISAVLSSGFTDGSITPVGPGDTVPTGTTGELVITSGGTYDVSTADTPYIIIAPDQPANVTIDGGTSVTIIGGTGSVGGSTSGSAGGDTIVSHTGSGVIALGGDRANVVSAEPNYVIQVDEGFLRRLGGAITTFPGSKPEAYGSYTIIGMPDVRTTDESGNPLPVVLGSLNDTAVANAVTGIDLTGSNGPHQGWDYILGDGTNEMLTTPALTTGSQLDPLLVGKNTTIAIVAIQYGPTIAGFSFVDLNTGERKIAIPSDELPSFYHIDTSKPVTLQGGYYDLHRQDTVSAPPLNPYWKPPSGSGGGIRAEIGTVTTGGYAMATDTGNDTVLALGSVNAAIFPGGGSNLVALGDGNYVVVSAGTDTIIASSGTASISVSGANSDMVYVDSSLLLFLNGSAPSTVSGDNGSVTIDGGSGGGLFIGGHGGGNSINAGTGAATVMAGGEDDVLLAGGAAPQVLYATFFGNDTIDASASSGTVTIFGGRGNSAITLGAGHDVLAFANGMAGGGNTVQGFIAGDTLALAGYAADETSNLLASQIVENGSLLLTLRDGTRITLANVTTLLDTPAVTTFVLPCFAKGTRIQTAAGETPVENLAIGDRIPTLIGRGDSPVIWIGHRQVDCRHHPAPKQVWPVRIRAGTFGRGVPRRDLLLSPDHAVYLQQVLIPVKCLINGDSIAQVPVDQVTYYHLELARHDVVLAEGLPAESYLDTGDRRNFANGGGAIALHPDFAALTWDAKGCAPLVVYGPHLEAARRMARTRTRERGTGDYIPRARR